MSSVLNPFSLRTLALGLSCLVASAAGAQANRIYVDLRPAVVGESKDKDRQGSIDANSFQWGVGRSISSPVGGNRRDVSAVSVSEIVWTQGLDTSVPQLLAQTFKADPKMPTAQIDLMGPDPKAPAPLLRFKLNGAVPTGVSLANDSASVSMGFEKISLDYREGVNPKTVSYNAPTGKATGEVSRPGVALNGGRTAEGIYLRLGNGNSSIAGDNATDGYQNWIQLSSYQFGVGLGFDPIRGEYSKPSLSEVTITQTYDGSVPVALGALLLGKNVGQATIEYVRSTSNGPVTFMQMVLDDVYLSGLSLSSGGGLPSVSESFNFVRFMQTVWDLDSNGARTGSRSVAYDIGLGKTIPDFDVKAGGANFGAGNLLAAAAAGGSLPPPAPAPIPEPASALLMLAGVGVLLAAVRRRAAAQPPAL